MKNFKVFHLSGYEVPKIVENRRNNWIEYGTDNNYFGQLIKRYLGSPTNSRCVNGISDMIYGRGINALDSDDKPGMFAEMKSILDPKDVHKIVNDLKMLGQAAVQVVYKNRKRQISGLFHFPMETLRAEKAKDGKIQAYYYHNDWKNIKPSDKPVSYTHLTLPTKA